jgi:fatty acid desaturase
MNAVIGLCAPAKPIATMTDQERASAITAAIKEADRDLRRRWSLLQYQDAIGLGFFHVSTTVTVVSSVLYIQGVGPSWACLMVNAICLSLLREIEHDLIHNLYFARRPFIQNLLMLAVWPFLGNLPHPWYRRRIHLLHHRTSGHDEDLEERLIGNGMTFGPLKVLAMIEPGLASLFRQKELRQIPFYNGREFLRALFPVAIFYVVTWYGWLVVHAAVIAGAAAGLPFLRQDDDVLRSLDTVAVVFLLPNLIRQVSVQILSSSMHYFGDVESRLQETYVLNAWWTLPLQIFACNFGSTHTIHHFVVTQPFYLRQLVARQAHAAFRKYGVRYNDTAAVLRGNRRAPRGCLAELAPRSTPDSQP